MFCELEDAFLSKASISCDFITDRGPLDKPKPPWWMNHEHTTCYQRDFSGKVWNVFLWAETDTPDVIEWIGECRNKSCHLNAGRT